jgi:hypothetical protein
MSAKLQYGLRVGDSPDVRDKAMVVQERIDTAIRIYGNQLTIIDDVLRVFDIKGEWSQDATAFKGCDADHGLAVYVNRTLSPLAMCRR